jgi:internalin A
MTGTLPALLPGVAALKHMLECLHDLDAEVAKLRADLPQVNDPDLRPRIMDLLAAAESIAATYEDGPGPAVTTTLHQLLKAVLALKLPTRDPEMGDATPTLTALRTSKGLIATGLMDCLAAAEVLGWSRPISSPPAHNLAAVPREAVAGIRPHIEARADAMESEVGKLRRMQNQRPIQIGLINFFGTSIRAQLRVAKAVLGEDLIDFEALRWVAERVGQLTKEFVVTARAFAQNLSNSAARVAESVAESVSQAARRVVNGITTAIKLLGRRFRATLSPPPELQVDDPTAETFDLNEVYRMIVAGQAPPPAWRPLITSLDFDTYRLTDLTPLSGLSALRALNLPVPEGRLTGKEWQLDLHPIAGLVSLRTLSIVGWRELWDLSPISELKSLERLSILAAPLVSDLRPIAKLRALTALDLYNTAVGDLGPLDNLTNLQILNLPDTKITTLEPLAGLTALKQLVFSFTKIEDISSLRKLTNLKVLHMNNTEIHEVSSLSDLQNLEVLDLSHTTVENVSSLRNNKVLKRLDLLNTRVSDLSFLTGKRQLSHLTLQYTEITELTHIQTLVSLKHLDLMATRIRDVSPLHRLSALRTLELTDTPVTDISPLVDLPALVGIGARGTTIDIDARKAFNVARVNRGLQPVHFS